MSCEDEHHHGDGHGHEEHLHVAPVPTNASQSLHSKIDLPHVTALNMSNPPDELEKIFRKSSDKYKLKPVISSDCDAQMIINIPFLNGSVKLYSITLRTNGDNYCPKTIKLFKNDKSVDFDNVEAKKSTYTLGHPQVGAMYEEDQIPESIEQDGDFVEHYLPRHKFTGVQHLTIFIQDIYEEDEDTDESRLHYIDLRGEFTHLNKDPVISLYELAANPAEHKNLTQAETTNFSLP
jgi:C-terminal proteasome-interacting domain of thioredoxin-like.